MHDEIKTAQITCDGITYRAAKMMIEEAGASVEMVVDRLLTFAAAQAVSMDGSANTAQVFRDLADRIDAGCFASIEHSPSKERH